MEFFRQRRVLLVSWVEHELHFGSSACELTFERFQRPLCQEFKEYCVLSESYGLWSVREYMLNSTDSDKESAETVLYRKEIIGMTGFPMQ